MFEKKNSGFSCFSWIDGPSELRQYLRPFYKTAELFYTVSELQEILLHPQPFPAVETIPRLCAQILVLNKRLAREAYHRLKPWRPMPDAVPDINLGVGIASIRPLLFTHDCLASRLGASDQPVSAPHQAAGKAQMSRYERISNPVPAAMAASGVTLPLEERVGISLATCAELPLATPMDWPVAAQMRSTG